MVTVLIVDDSATVRASLKRVLLGIGLDVLEASDGHSAIGLVDSEPCDAAILDLNMPGMNGIELARAIRERSRPCRVVMLTSMWGPKERKLAEEAGVDAYLVKPSPPLVITETLLRLLSGAGSAAPWPAEADSRREVQPRETTRP